MKKKIVSGMVIGSVALLAAMGLAFLWWCPQSESAIKAMGSHWAFKRQIVWNALGVAVCCGVAALGWKRLLKVGRDDGFDSLHPGKGGAHKDVPERRDARQARTIFRRSCANILPAAAVCGVQDGSVVRIRRTVFWQSITYLGGYPPKNVIDLLVRRQVLWYNIRYEN